MKKKKNNKCKIFRLIIITLLSLFISITIGNIISPKVQIFVDTTEVTTNNYIILGIYNKSLVNVYSDNNNIYKHTLIINNEKYNVSLMVNKKTYIT